jgi:hypothetical protein
VADNGVGMPDNFDIKNSSTLGLQIHIRLSGRKTIGKGRIAGIFDLLNQTHYARRFQVGYRANF